MVPIMRACGNPRYRRVIAVLGAQMGKTEAFFNVIGHRLDDDPVPILYVGPTQKQVESVGSDRVPKMLQSVPSLWAKLAKGKKNKITEKHISGVRLGFGWAGSATELASHPAGLVLVDERDRMEAIKGEGDPVELAEARVSNYPGGKVCVVSTPTLGFAEIEVDEHGFERWTVADEMPSPIWQLWQEGVRFEWAWPCPECAEYFVPRFKHLTWPEGCTAQRAAKEARLACPHCGALIEERSKLEMNERGLYVAPGQHIVDGEVAGEPPESDTASFWVSGLCSPWRTFGSRARSYLAALQSGEQGRVQAVMNTGFGELYHGGGEAPEWKVVTELREGYASGTVPEGVHALTCCIDVQKDRLVYAVRGWGFNFESWLIEAGELYGLTAQDPVWLLLAELLQREFDGRHIMYAFIDSGYNPGDTDRTPDHRVYLFCWRYQQQYRDRVRDLGTQYVRPSKGHDRQDKPYRATKIDFSHKGQVFKGGIELWHVDTDFCKSFVHARLVWPKGESGAWHLPHDATDDYCKQVVAEHRVAGAGGRFKWVRLARENHYLDVEGLNVAAAHIIGVQQLRPPERAPEQPAAPAPPPQAVRALTPPRRNWVTSF